jgi:hypothetical protein
MDPRPPAGHLTQLLSAAAEVWAMVLGAPGSLAVSRAALQPEPTPENDDFALWALELGQ